VSETCPNRTNHIERERESRERERTDLIRLETLEVRAHGLLIDLKKRYAHVLQVQNDYGYKYGVP
jgi:hypothetical protein